MKNKHTIDTCDGCAKSFWGGFIFGIIAAIVLWFVMIGFAILG